MLTTRRSVLVTRAFLDGPVRCPWCNTRASQSGHAWQLLCHDRPTPMALDKCTTAMTVPQTQTHTEAA